MIYRVETQDDEVWSWTGDFSHIDYARAFTFGRGIVTRITELEDVDEVETLVEAVNPNLYRDFVDYMSAAAELHEAGYEIVRKR